MVDSDENEGAFGTIGAAARRQFQDHGQESEIDAARIQHNSNRDRDQAVETQINVQLTDYGDPAPPPISASRDQIQVYKDAVDAYAVEMLQSLHETHL